MLLDKLTFEDKICISIALWFQLFIYPCFRDQHVFWTWRYLSLSRLNALGLVTAAWSNNIYSFFLSDRITCDVDWKHHKASIILNMYLFSLLFSLLGVFERIQKYFTDDRAAHYGWRKACRARWKPICRMPENLPSHGRRGSHHEPDFNSQWAHKWLTPGSLFCDSPLTNVKQGEICICLEPFDIHVLMPQQG